MPIARPDGSVAEVEWRIVAENGHGARIAIATNVTERERLLESERAARTEAERSNRLKDEFLATLSHELRNPLNAMLGWASVLKRKNVTPAMLEQGLDAIERNSRVQSHLIEDLLDFAGHPLRQDAHRRGRDSAGARRRIRGRGGAARRRKTRAWSCTCTWPIAMRTCWPTNRGCSRWSGTC